MPDSSLDHVDHDHVASSVVITTVVNVIIIMMIIVFFFFVVVVSFGGCCGDGDCGGLLLCRPVRVCALYL